MAQHPAVREVLATAAAEIGYSRWKDDQQGTKYARETQPVFWPRDTWLLANGISFCDIWVTWVFWKALGKNFVTDGGLPAGASYNTDYRASKGGRVSKPPRPGDVLVFDWNWATASTNHVGILEKVLASGNYQTIEGNTSLGTAGSQSNGGGVYRRVRRPDQVRHVIRPNWSKARTSGVISKPAAADPTRPWRTSARITAMTTAQVKAIQAELIGAGYDLGPWGADGSYGDATGTAVQQLQTTLDLTADGVWGPATQEALMTLKTDIAKLQKDVGRLIAFGEQIHWRVDTMPQRVLDAPVDLEGIDKGKVSTLRRKIAYQHNDYRNTLAQIASARAALLEAVQETGKAQGLTSEQVQAIAAAAAEASARVSAEDVAERLEVGVRED